MENDFFFLIATTSLLPLSLKVVKLSGFDFKNIIIVTLVDEW